MKKLNIVFLAFFISACWSSNEPVNTNSSNANISKIPVNAEIVKISNSNSKLKPYESNISLEEVRKKQNQNAKILKGKKTKKVEEKPAPDNSIFKTRLDAEGFTATRTFIDHPKLIKIEKKQKGNETTLKVYLKNGKVYDVSEKKIPNFRVNSPDHILSSIGLGSKQETKPQINKDKMEKLKPRKR